MTHEIKTWPEAFQLVFDGFKRFECRRNDRDYKPLDRLHLREYDPATGLYSGREIRNICVVGVFPGGAFGIEAGYVVMSFGQTNWTYVIPGTQDLTRKKP